MKFNFTKSIARYLRAAIGTVLTMSLVFQVAFNTAIGAANAATHSNAILVAASMSEMAEKVQDKAGQAVDNVADSIDRTAAKLRDDAKDVDVVGRAQQQVNKVKEAADENEYRNRGKARAAIDRAQDNIGDSARAASDDAKYAMRKGANKAESQAKQVKAKGEETKGNVVDAVKGFFGK
jgi:ABC-type transport system involved in cytochrome bd biosynthesis fused ATPase/permease subunit